MGEARQLLEGEEVPDERGPPKASPAAANPATRATRVDLRAPVQSGVRPVDWLIIGLGNPGASYAERATTSASRWPTRWRGGGTSRAKTSSTAS